MDCLKQTNIIVLFIISFSLMVIIPAYPDEGLDTKAKRYVYSIFATSKLSPDDRERYAGRGGANQFFDPTLQLAWIMENWENLGDETKAALKTYVNPDALLPGGDGRTLPRVASLWNQQVHTTEFFNITYSTTDYFNAVSSTDVLNENLSSGSNDIPDIIDRIAYRLDRAYSYQVTTLGFPAPVFESGKSQYEVYVLDTLDCGFVQEYTEPPACSAGQLLGFANPLSATYPKPFYLVLDHDYWGDNNLLNDNIAHEFFHAIQFGRDNGPPIEGNLWYFEGTAVWMQDMSWSSDYYVDFYLTGVDGTCNNWFSCTHLSLETDTSTPESILFPYGKVTFFKFLTEYKNMPNAVKNIQDLAVTTQTGIDSVKQYVTNNWGTTMQDLIIDFGKSFLDLDKYTDGSLYVPEAGFSRYEIDQDHTYTNTDLVVNHHGYLTYEFYTSEGASSLTVNTTLASNMRIGIEKCTGRRSGCITVLSGHAIIGFGSTYPYVYAIVANGDSSNDNPSYSISVDIGPMPTAYSLSLPEDKWELVYLPVEPASSIPSDVFTQEELHLYVAGNPYSSLNNRNTANSDLLLSAPVWIFNETGSNLISFQGSSTTNPSLSTNVYENSWAVIGSPDPASATPYADGNVSITWNSTTYSLSEAISSNLIGDLYTYDSDTNNYSVVTPQSGSLQEWKAYLLKPDFTGVITVTESP